MRLVLVSVSLGLAALAAIIAGPQAFGRLALAAQMPSLAASLLDAPHARGVALFEAGRYDEADLAFEAAGRDATYDRGLSLAMRGRYADAVAYFDAVLFADPADADARHNREVLGKLVPDIVGESNSIDGVPANVQAEESAAVATKRDIPSTLTLAEQRGVMDPRVKRMTAATEAWLTTLTDEPALYLKRRIKAEYERRQDLGLANPPEDNAW